MNYGKYNNKRPMVRRVITSPIFFVVILIVFIVLARAAWGIHEKVVLSATKLEQAEAELVKLKARESDLQSGIGRLSTDQGIESLIRTQYKGVRDGESLAVVIGTDDTASVAQSSSTASVGWFRGLLQKMGL